MIEPRTIGRIIVVEGLDGCGKTTTSWALAHALGARWLTTPGQSIRDVRRQFDAAFSHSPAARSLAYGATVIAAGEQAATWTHQGQDVVVDRYWLSTLVYAADAAQQPLAAMSALVRAATITLFLHAPLSLRGSRLAGRSTSVHDAHTLVAAEDQRLNARYTALSTHDSAGRWLPISAQGRPDQVLDRALRAIAA